MIHTAIGRIRRLMRGGNERSIVGGTAEAALRESEQRFRDFAEAASDWFWEMNRDLRFTFFSQRREEVTGLAAEGALGKTRWEVVGVDPDRDPHWSEHYRTLKAQKPFRDFRYSYVAPATGRRFHWKVSGKPFFDEDGTFCGYRGTCTDITAEIEAETRAGAAHALLARAIDAMPGGLAIFDSGDRLIMCNRHYAAPAPELDGQIRPGMTFEGVVRTAARANFYFSEAADIEAVVRRRIERHRNPRGPFEQRLGNGQWVMFNEFRLGDGSTIVLRLHITDLKKAQEEAERAHTLLVDAIESIPASFILYGPDERIVLWNSKAPTYFPEIRDLFTVGMTAEAMTRARYRWTMQDATEEAIEARVSQRMREFRFPGASAVERLADGRWTQARESRTSDGGTVCIRTDISDRIQGEDALRESRELLQAVIDTVPAMINAKDSESRYILINRYQANLYGTTESKALGRSAADFMPRTYGDYTASLDRQVFKTGRPIPYFEETYPDARGVEHTWLTTKVPLKDALGGVKNVVSVALEITDRKLAEQALKDSEKRFRDIAESAGDWIWEMGPDLRFTYLSPRFYELFSVSHHEILGRTRLEFSGASMNDERWRRHAEELARRQPFRNFQYSVHQNDGSVSHIRISGKPVFGEKGDFRGYRGTGTDVTAEVESVAHARHAETLLLEAIESIAAGFALFDAEDRLVLCNSRYRDRFPGLDVSRPGITFEEIVIALAKHGAYRIEPSQTLEEVVQTRLKHHRELPASHDQQFSDGTWVHIDEFPTHDGGSVILRTDITEQRRLEQHLVEAQRMEAIGRLTGGIAHDFNNLLSIIIGNLKLLERRAAGQENVGKHIRLATGAAERGAELTRRLLAFSRHQVLEAEVIDVNRLIADMESLLLRTLGETINVEFRLASEPWPTKVDPGQLENALLNLAINARDAMSDEGRLTIETANAVLDDEYAARHADVSPGEYVMVAVADTGCGIPPESLGRIFEPFFTTKEVGKGTGLGLSMVYGLVKQSGGHIKAYSEPGVGTTMKLYLRRTASPAAPRRAIAKVVPVTGSETILVVEDDEEVRQTAVALLAELGYPVVEAADGWQALEILDRRADIQLLFTDVVMPRGMRGPDLAREARQRRPSIRILYTSGYTENGAFAAGIIEAGAMFVGKPLQLDELALKIRRVLDDRRLDERQ